MVGSKWRDGKVRSTLSRRSGRGFPWLSPNLPCPCLSLALAPHPIHHHRQCALVVIGPPSSPSPRALLRHRHQHPTTKTTTSLTDPRFSLSISLSYALPNFRIRAPRGLRLRHRRLPVLRVPPPQPARQPRRRLLGRLLPAAAL